MPQGSILGPLLFLIFINDLPSSISSSEILLFADHTKCLKKVSSHTDSIVLQDDLLCLSNWSQKWNLHFNEKECVLLRFCLSPSPTLFDYLINSTPIQVLNCHRDLGILMSCDLKWSHHYKFISSRAYKILGLIRRSFSGTLPSATKRKLYLSLVRSQLSYSSHIWRPYLLKDISALERIQQRATKYILHDFNSDYRERLLSLELLPLMMQFELLDIMFFIRCLKDSPKEFPILTFIQFSESNTRSSSHNKLKHSLSKTNLEGHFFFNQLPRLWNSLPPLNLHLSN